MVHDIVGGVAQRGSAGKGVRPQPDKCLLQIHLQLDRDHPDRLVHLSPAIRQTVQWPVVRRPADAGRGIQHNLQRDIGQDQRIGQLGNGQRTGPLTPRSGRWERAGEPR